MLMSINSVLVESERLDDVLANVPLREKKETSSSQQSAILVATKGNLPVNPPETTRKRKSSRYCIYKSVICIRNCRRIYPVIPSVLLTDLHRSRPKYKHALRRRRTTTTHINIHSHGQHQRKDWLFESGICESCSSSETEPEEKTSRSSTARESRPTAAYCETARAHPPERWRAYSCKGSHRGGCSG